MAYLILCRDKKNSIEKRLTQRPAHVEYLKKFEKKIICAGPILNKDNEPVGSVIILDFDKIEDAKIFVKNDPYNDVDLFSEVKLTKFKRVF